MNNSIRYHRRGFTLVELLVAIAIIGVLVSLLLPAIQEARETARKTSCKNNMKQIGLALHNYHSTYQRFPSGWTTYEGEFEPGWAWSAAILPYLEQGDLYRGIVFEEAIEQPFHAEERETLVPTYICPSDVGPRLFGIAEDPGGGHHHGATPWAAPAVGIDAGGTELFPVAKSNYTGMFGSEEIHDDPWNGNGAFYAGSELRFANFTDGTSQTIMVGERGSRLGSCVWAGVIPEALEAEARVVGVADHVPNHEAGHFEDFSSMHRDGANFLFTDGSTRLISDTIDVTVYQSLATRGAGDIVGDF